MQQAAPHAVAAVGDIRKGQRVIFVTESPQRKEQILVAAVAGHDLGRLQAEMRRCRAQQLGTGGVGVKAQLFHLGFAHGCHHPGRRQIGAFVGIQFDVLLILRLFSRRVGGDSGQGRGKKTAHNGFLRFILLWRTASPSQSSLRDARFPLLSLRDIFPRPGEVGPQSGSPWQSTQTSSLCQGLSLWERWRGVSRDGEGAAAFIFHTGWSRCGRGRADPRARQSLQCGAQRLPARPGCSR